jgi:hypothetical protein
MGKDQQPAFGGACAVGAGAQVGGEPAFGAAEDAFGLPSSSVFVRGEVAPQRATVFAARRELGMSSGVNRNDRFANAPLFAAPAVMFFRVIGSVAKQPTDRDPPHRFFDGGQEAGCVVARPSTKNRRQDEMAAMIDDGRELSPPAMRRGSTRMAAAIKEVAADIMVFQPRRIDARFTCRGQQLEFSGVTNDLS